MSGVAHARNLIGPILASTYRMRITGVHHLPSRGGVLLVGEQRGLLDATILASGLTRPVRVLAQRAGTAPRWSSLTSALGRIDIDSHVSVWPALQEGVAALRRGEAVAAFTASSFAPVALAPPAAVAAYLHARSGVPIVAVTMFDTSGPRPSDIPRPRSIIECHLGPPREVPIPVDPLYVAALRQHAERIRQVCVDADEIAADRTGRILDRPEPHNGQRD